MRKTTLENGKFKLEDEVKEILERTVKPFGTSARVNIPKKYINKRTYILILED